MRYFCGRNIMQIKMSQQGTTCDIQKGDHKDAANNVKKHFFPAGWQQNKISQVKCNQLKPVTGVRDINGLLSV